jgi:hypothetical protein
VKSTANVPSEAATDIKEALLTPGKNYGKDNYTIELAWFSRLIWIVIVNDLSVSEHIVKERAYICLCPLITTLQRSHSYFSIGVFLAGGGSQASGNANELRARLQL